MSKNISFFLTLALSTLMMISTIGCGQKDDSKKEGIDTISIDNLRTISFTNTQVFGMRGPNGKLFSEKFLIIFANNRVYLEASSNEKKCRVSEENNSEFSIKLQSLLKESVIMQGSDVITMDANDVNLTLDYNDSLSIKYFLADHYGPQTKFLSNYDEIRTLIHQKYNKTLKEGSCGMIVLK